MGQTVQIMFTAEVLFELIIDLFLEEMGLTHPLTGKHLPRPRLLSRGREQRLKAREYLGRQMIVEANKT